MLFEAIKESINILGTRPAGRILGLGVATINGIASLPKGEALEISGLFEHGSPHSFKQLGLSSVANRRLVVFHQICRQGLFVPMATHTHDGKQFLDGLLAICTIFLQEGRYLAERLHPLFGQLFSLGPMRESLGEFHAVINGIQQLPDTQLALWGQPIGFDLGTLQGSQEDIARFVARIDLVLHVIPAQWILAVLPACFLEVEESLEQFFLRDILLIIEIIEKPYTRLNVWQIKGCHLFLVDILAIEKTEVLHKLPETKLLKEWVRFGYTLDVLDFHLSRLAVRQVLILFKGTVGDEMLLTF